MEWGGWRAFRDVNALARSGDWSWPEFVDLARDSRGATSCYWTLRLARGLAGAPIPDDVLRAFRRDVSLPYLRLLPPGFSCVTTITMSFLSNQHQVE
jgi:hypothetical protein